MRVPILPLIFSTLLLWSITCVPSWSAAPDKKEKERDKATPSAPGNGWNPVPETVVIYNPSFPGSEDLAKFYAEKRGISKEHLLPITCSQEETISRDEFENTIRGPLLQAFKDKKWWEVEKCT